MFLLRDLNILTISLNSCNDKAILEKSEGGRGLSTRLKYQKISETVDAISVGFGGRSERFSFNNIDE